MNILLSFFVGLTQLSTLTMSLSQHAVMFYNVGGSCPADHALHSELEERIPIGQSTNFTLGSTGGEDYVTLNDSQGLGLISFDMPYFPYLVLNPCKKDEDDQFIAPESLPPVANTLAAYQAEFIPDGLNISMQIAAFNNTQHTFFSPFKASIPPWWANINSTLFQFTMPSPPTPTSEDGTIESLQILLGNLNATQSKDIPIIFDLLDDLIAINNVTQENITLLQLSAIRSNNTYHKTAKRFNSYEAEAKKKTDAATEIRLFRMSIIGGAFSSFLVSFTLTYTVAFYYIRGIIRKTIRENDPNKEPDEPNAPSEHNANSDLDESNAPSEVNANSDLDGSNASGDLNANSDLNGSNLSSAPSTNLDGSNASGGLNKSKQDNKSQKSNKLLVRADPQRRFADIVFEL